MRLIKKLLLFTLLISFQGISQPTFTVSTTDCSTWNCSPCDGTFTLTLNNPNTAGPYTFWLMDPGGTTIYDSITTTNTTHTFTGLCQGNYWTDMTWGNPTVTVVPCTNCTGASGCPTCPPGGAASGSGAGGTVGAPLPLLDFTMDIFAAGPCGFTQGYVSVDVTGQAPPFTVTFVVQTMWGTSNNSMQTNDNAIMYMGCNESIDEVIVTDATGQTISQLTNYWATTCGSTILMDPIPTIEVCAGEPIGPLDISPYSSVVDGISQPYNWSDFTLTNDNTQTGVPTSDQGSTFQYVAANVSSTQTSTITVTPFTDPWSNVCYVNSTVFQVIVHPLPNVDAGADITVCEGQAVTLNGSGDGTLTWSNGVANGSSFTPTVGVHELVLTAVTANGCELTDTLVVNVDSAPAIDAGADIFDCEGASISLNSAYPNSTWTGPASSGVVPPGYTSLTLEVDWGNGCTSTDSLTVFGEAQPVVSITADLTVCEGDTVTLTSAMSAGGNYLSSTPIGSNIPGITIDSDVPFVPPVGTWINTANGNIQWCTDSDMMTLVVLPAPIIDAGVDVTICYGDSVQLTGSGGVNYTWSGNVNDGDYVVPASDSTFYVEGVDGNNCSNIDSIEVMVLSLPVIDAGVDQTVCLGDSVLLVANGANTYTWDNGVGDSTFFSPVLGSQFIAVEGIDSNGCMSSDTVEIIVNPLPVVDAGQDQSICPGDSIILAGTGALTYQWNQGVQDGVSFTPNSAMSYVVIGTDANGCLNVDSVYIDVLNLPAVDAGADALICLGDSVQLNATGINISWSSGAQNGDYVIGSSVGAITLIATETGANGCEAQDTMIITVLPLPTIDAGVDVFACESEQVSLQANAGSPGALSWSGGVFDNTPFSVLAGNTTYYVTIVDTLGCSAMDSVVVFGDSIPTPSFVADVVAGCAPLEVTFSNTSSGNLSDCSWDFGNGDVGTGCGNQTVIYNESGYFDVSLSVQTIHGCYNDTLFSNYIYVEPDPIANFGLSPLVLSFLEPTINTTNLSTGASNYQWDFGDASPLQFGVNEQHTYDAESYQAYIIELVAFSPLGCSDTAVRTITFKEEVIFYVPNTFSPDDDEHNQLFEPVITSGIDRHNYNLQIYNRWGERIFESNTPELGWDGTYKGAYCQDGTYTWRLEFKLLDGDERRIEYGHVNLLR